MFFISLQKVRPFLRHSKFRISNFMVSSKDKRIKQAICFTE